MAVRRPVAPKFNIRGSTGPVRRGITNRQIEGRVDDRFRRDMEAVSPYLNRAQDRLAAKLAAQGINQGSTNYREQFNDLNASQAEAIGRLRRDAESAAQGWMGFDQGWARLGLDQDALNLRAQESQAGLNMQRYGLDLGSWNQRLDRSQRDRHFDARLGLERDRFGLAERQADWQMGMGDRQFAHQVGQDMWGRGMAEQQFGLDRDRANWQMGHSDRALAHEIAMGQGNLALQRDQFGHQQAQDIWGREFAQDQFEHQRGQDMWGRDFAADQFAWQQDEDRWRRGMSEGRFDFEQQQWRDERDFRDVQTALQNAWARDARYEDRRRWDATRQDQLGQQARDNAFRSRQWGAQDEQRRLDNLFRQNQWNAQQNQWDRQYDLQSDMFAHQRANDQWNQNFAQGQWDQRYDLMNRQFANQQDVNQYNAEMAHWQAMQGQQAQNFQQMLALYDRMGYNMPQPGAGTPGTGAPNVVGAHSVAGNQPNPWQQGQEMLMGLWGQYQMANNILAPSSGGPLLTYPGAGG